MTPEDRAAYPPVEATLRNGSTVTLRWLTPADGEALADFYADIPREAFRFYCPHELDREHALANAARADSPLEVVLVADAGGGIVGYAWYRWSAPEAERSTFGICLRPAHQHLGLGRALMTRLLEIARHLGPAVMDLTVQHANPGAVALYTSMGFVPVREQVCAERFGFPEEPEYYMERPTR